MKKMYLITVMTFIDDPRQELMERLIEYKKYKQVATELKEREQERAQLYTRPPIDFTSLQQEEETSLPLDVTLYDMLAAFQKLMRRKSKETCDNTYYSSRNTN